MLPRMEVCNAKCQLIRLRSLKFQNKPKLVDGLKKGDLEKLEIALEYLYLRYFIDGGNCGRECLFHWYAKCRVLEMEAKKGFNMQTFTIFLLWCFLQHVLYILSSKAGQMKVKILAVFYFKQMYKQSLSASRPSDVINVTNRENY